MQRIWEMEKNQSMKHEDRGASAMRVRILH